MILTNTTSESDRRRHERAMARFKAQCAAERLDRLNSFLSPRGKTWSRSNKFIRPPVRDLH
jgi:hypothetical protein